MKKRISLDIDESLLAWVEEQIKLKKFQSITDAVESSLLYRRKRFGKKVGKKKECVVCEKMFIRGWNPKFDKEHGICQRCLKRKDIIELSDEPQEREQQLIEVFRDFA